VPGLAGLGAAVGCVGFPRGFAGLGAARLRPVASWSSSRLGSGAGRITQRCSYFAMASSRYIASISSGSVVVGLGFPGASLGLAALLVGVGCSGASLGRRCRWARWYECGVAIETRAPATMRMVPVNAFSSALRSDAGAW